MTPDECKDIPLEDWKILDQFKTDISLELSKHEDPDDFDAELWHKIVQYYGEKKSQRMHAKNLRGYIAGMDAFLYPAESDFVRYLYDLEKQIGPEPWRRHFDKLFG